MKLPPVFNLANMLEEALQEIHKLSVTLRIMLRDELFKGQPLHNSLGALLSLIPSGFTFW